MAKNIQVNLTFSADTSAAKAQMQQLQQSLSNLAATPLNSVGTKMLKDDLHNATTAALQLKIALENATNVNTGKLNFTKFNQELKASKKDLNAYAIELSKLGPQGTQAFAQLASAIRQSETPLMSLQGKFKKLADTMANTIRWQITSSITTGLISVFRSVIDYAEDLNESLNKIRIVTGKSIEEVSQFAKEANKAAKALSASTLEYTDASLIYYQQGLNDKEVKSRTDTTVKLANVTRENAQTVSEWMTAIWNNFDDGSKSLEYYADVLTKLGAATASSADEIAGGLEKFAAISQTVGLSYEYAAAALATITAETRQSEDVVGTSLKTIFARIENLQLGKTLEDGTTLGQYSEALSKVGVSINDANGNLKDMDNILDEIGTRWQSLNKNEQVALAQSVAGIRQYNQFIALMDNYDVMQNNVAMARDATGELEKQNKIYEQSVEAASKRIENTIEKIKNTLLDENDLVPILNTLESILSFVSDLIESMGGLNGIIGVVTASLMKMYGPQMVSGMQSMINSVKGIGATLTGKAQSDRAAAAVQATSLASKMAASDQSADQAGIVQSYYLKEKLELTQKIEALGPTISKNAQELLNLEMQLLETEAERAQLKAQEADAAAEVATQTGFEADKFGVGLDPEDEVSQAIAREAQINTLGTQVVAPNQIKSKLDNIEKGFSDEEKQDLIELRTQVEESSKILEQKIEQLEQAKQALLDGTMSQEDYDNKANEVKTAEEDALNKQKDYAIKASEVNDQSGKINNKRNQIKDNFKTQRDDSKKRIKELEDEEKAYQKLTGKKKKLTKDEQKEYKRLQDSSEDRKKALEKEQKGLEELTNIEEEAIEAYDNNVEANIKSAEATEKSANANSNLRDKVGAVGKTVDETIPTINKGYSEVVTIMSGLTAGISGVYMVVNAFQALGASIADGTATFSDYLAAAMSAMMGLGQLASAVDTLKKSEIAQVAWEKIRMIITKKSAQVSQESAKKEVVAEGEKQDANITTGLTEIAKDAAKGPAGWAIAAISAAAFAAIIGTAVALGISSSAPPDPNDEAAAAEEEAAHVAESYAKVKEAYDTLVSNIEDYRGAQEAIAALKEGTEEWYEAIQKNNDIVLQMLDTYPELIDQIETVNGQLILTDGGFKLLQAQRAKAIGLQNASAQASLDASNAKANATKANLVGNELDTYGGWEMAGDIALGTMATALTAMFPTLAFLTAGGAINTIVSKDQSAASASDEALSDIIDLYQEQGNAIFADFDQTLADLEITDPELIEKLKENKDAVQELAEIERQNLERAKLLEQQKVDNILYSQDHFISDKYDEGLQKIIKDEYDKIYAEGEVDPEDLYNTGLWQSSTAEGEDVFKEYANIMNLEDATTTDFANGRVYFDTKDESDQSVSYEEMARVVSEVRAANRGYELVNKANQLTAQLYKLDNSGSVENQVLSSYLQYGNLNYLDPELAAKFQAGELEITDDLARKFGYDYSGTRLDLAEQLDAFSDEEMEKLAKAADIPTLGEQLKADLEEAMQSYDAEAARINRMKEDMAKANQTLASGAAELEMSETVLRAYAEELWNSSDALAENKKLAAELAVNHFRVAKGIKNLKDVFKDNVNVLKDSSASTLDYYEALGAVKDQLEKTFGTKVSADFVKKNLQLIEGVANEDVEALKELRSALVEDFIINLTIDDSYKTALQQEMQELMAQAENSDLGVELNFDNTQAIAGLNQALEAGEITIAEIENMFANANLAMPKYNIAHVPTTTKSHSVSKISGGWWGKDYTVNTETTNTTWSDVPYFGDNPPIYEDPDNDGTYTKVSGTGIESGSGFKVSSAGNTGVSKDLLTYEGDDDGAREKAKKDLKKLDEEIERYHEIKEELSDIEVALGRISSAKDRAFGASKLQLIDDEIAKTEEAIEAQKRYIDEIKSNLADDTKNLNKWGFSTDESGRVTNYDEVMAKQVAAYNAAIKGGNKEKADERWEEFQNALSQYEETLNLLQDEETKLIEDSYKLRSLKLERITEEVELAFSLTEDRLKDIEFQMSRLEDSAYDAAKAISLMHKEAEGIANDMDAAEKGIRDILGEDADAFLAGDFTNLDLEDLTKEEIQQLRDYKDELYEGAQRLQEINSEIHERSVQGFVDLVDESAEFGEQLRSAQSVVQSFQNIVDIVGKDRLGLDDAFMDSMAERNKKIAADAVTADRMAYETAEAEYQKAVASGNFTDKELKEMYAAVQDAQTQFMDSWASALETAAEEFDNKVQRIIETYSKAMGDLEHKADQLAKKKEIDDFFLKDYEKTYEISKLSRQITESMNKTINSKGKQDLANLNAEILEYQKQGKEMSDYDLQYLQKKYELTQAQIALEEAQNAKSQVRLTRDSEGNFGYTYTADQSAIDKAQQTYEDKIYGMEKFLDESSTDIASQILSLQQQMTDELAALDKNAEDYEQRAGEIVSHYSGLINNLMSEASNMVQYGMEINQQYGTHAAETFHETMLGHLYTDYSDFAELQSDISENIGDVLEGLIDAHNTFEIDVDRVMTNAGTSVDTFGTDASEDLGKVDTQVNKLNEDIESMPDKFETAFSGDGGILDQLDKWVDQYNTKFKPYMDAADNLGSKITALIAKYAELAKAKKDYEENKTTEGDPNTTVNPGGSGTTTTTNYEQNPGDTSGTWTIGASRKIKGEKYRQYDLTRTNADGTTTTIQRFENDLINTNGSDKFNKGDIVTVKDGTAPQGVLIASKRKFGNNYVVQTSGGKWYLVPSNAINGQHVVLDKAYSDMAWVTETGINNLKKITGGAFTSETNDQKAYGIDMSSSPPEVNYWGMNSGSHAGYVFDDFIGKPVQFNDTGKTAKDTGHKVWEVRAGGKYLNLTSQALGTLLNVTASDLENAFYGIKMFDTGGYTGAWGPEGRLAMLHQKEIVLNAHDTENLLTAVEVVRSMADKLALNAAMASQGLGNLVSSAYFSPRGENFEQNITIYADFPNATDRDSILEAFEHLSASAMQYANSVDSLRAISRI